MNSELCKHYLQQQFNPEKIPEVVYGNIIQTLDKHFNYNWTYEVVNEFPIIDGTNIVCTVQVYVPGRVLTGRCTCKSTDYATAHLRAILDAVQYIIDEKAVYSSQPNQNDISQSNNGQMTVEQISAALSEQQESKMVNTKEQFYNYTENGVATTEVPMDKMTDNCYQELTQEVTGNQQGTSQSDSTPQSPTPQAPAKPEPATVDKNDPNYNMPQKKLGGYSQKQVDAINKFKKDFDVVDDQMFGSWVQSWDMTMTQGKKSLTPMNVDNFLAYIDCIRKNYQMGLGSGQ